MYDTLGEKNNILKRINSKYKFKTSTPVYTVYQTKYRFI